jgi:hypothetical protein
LLHSRGFFQLQIRFVQGLSRVLDRPADELLFDYTAFRTVLAAERLAPADPLWREFADGFRRADDPVEWTLGFYLRHAAPDPPPGASTYRGSKLFGPFTYDTWSAGVVGERVVVRPHLHTRVAGSGTLIGRSAQADRRADLRALFADVRERLPGAESVRGHSWLYNLEAYRRLFPPEYARSMAVCPHGDYQHLARWGQFFNRRWEVNAALAKTLLDRVAALTDPARLIDCFPYPILNPECELRYFYRFYGLADP